MRQKTDSLVYDFKVMGTLDETILKILSGSPSITSDKLRTNNAEVCTFGQWRFGRYEFVINFATAPTAGHARAWGLKSIALGNRGRIQFEISGTTFRAVAYDNAGNQIMNTTLTWDVGYTGAATRFVVLWNRGLIQFFIGDTKVAESDAGDAVPTLPLALHVDNDVADATDSTAWAVMGAESFN